MRTTSVRRGDLKSTEDAPSPPGRPPPGRLRFVCDEQRVAGVAETTRHIVRRGKVCRPRLGTSQQTRWPAGLPAISYYCAASLWSRHELLWRHLRHFGAESVKLAMVVPSAAKTPPAILLPPDCSSGVPGCVRLPQPVAAPAGLVLDRSAPLFTATTGGPANGSPTYAAAFGDVNGDGAPDLFLGVARDTNELWINDGTGSFTAATGGPASGIANTKAAAFGDVNGDGVR